MTTTAIGVHRISLRDLGVSFPTSSGPRPAVQGVTLDVGAGEFTAIVGPSGCGKSTVLNVIAGLQDPAAGAAYLEGTEVSGTSHTLGYLFQKDALLPWKTVLKNVMLPLVFRGLPKKEAEERARSWISRVRLEGFEGHYPHQLSGGMRKRVALATVFVYEPTVLLMDEPFSALDVQTRNLMEDELLDLWQDSRPTVIFVTHDLEEAIGLADRVVVFTASPGTIKGDYAIDIPRPRNLIDLRTTEEFQGHYERIWSDLREEVVVAYEERQ